MDRKKQAEAMAEAFAADFIEEAANATIFIGPYIERILANKAKVIYQYVEDSEYYGAAIKHFSGKQFIALNTFHPLRIRYFTAAHELWHLAEFSRLQDKDFDHERAADRFAAAVMLPKAITKDLWLKLNKLYEHKEAIIHLADMSSMPYEAVARRLKELGIYLKVKKMNEEEWFDERKNIGLPESPLDLLQPLNRFVDYVDVIEEAHADNRIDSLSASNKLSRYNPEKAAKLQTKAIKVIEEAHKNEA